MKKLIAIILYILGKKASSSTFIDEDTITMGYGHLDHLGDFEYPLPDSIIKRKFKTLSWDVYLKMKGVTK